ncbi:MAG: Peptidase-C39-2 domain-containing protein [Lachnoclostridium sp.]
MFKKFVAALLAITLSLGTVLTTGASVFEEKNSKDPGLYVFTKETSNEIITYAVNKFPGMLLSHLKNNNMNANIDEFRLGMPINIKANNSVGRIYHFPVFQGDSVSCILTVYDDGNEYYVQLEESLLAKKLDSYMNKTDENNAIKFVSDEDGFYAFFDGQYEPLTPESLINKSNFDISNTTGTKADEKAIDLSKTLATASTVTIQETPSSKVLSVKSVPQTDDGTFNGTQMNWCGAACTAAIINYKKSKSLTAKDVTIKALGSAKDEGITNDQVIKVAKEYNLSPKSGDPLSSSTVIDEIVGLRPIFMQMQRDTGSGKAYHALVLIGYDSTKYTIINPWYENSLTITRKSSGSDVTYVTGDRTYKWYKSVYNWK